MITGQDGAVILCPVLSCPAGQDESKILSCPVERQDRGPLQDRTGQDTQPRPAFLDVGFG